MDGTKFFVMISQTAMEGVLHKGSMRSSGLVLFTETGLHQTFNANQVHDSTRGLIKSVEGTTPVKIIEFTIPFLEPHH